MGEEVMSQVCEERVLIECVLVMIWPYYSFTYMKYLSKHWYILVVNPELPASLVL